MNRFVRCMLWVLIWLPLSASAQVKLEISGANFRPMPIAFPVPLADAAAKANLSQADEAFLFDFMACGLFQVLDRKSYLAKPDEGMTGINFEPWTSVGAEALIKVELIGQGDQLRGEVRVFTVGSGREEFKATQTKPAAQARRLAHALANDVYKFFTRETGPFESRISFVRKSGADRNVYLSDWDGKNAQVVASGGLNVLPAMHPDGQRVAFTSYRKGKPDLYLQRPGAEPQTLVQTGRMATGVAFSPDGKKMAFSVAQGEGAQIHVANADGSNSKQITNTPFFINTSPAWSPDNRRLAFVSNRGGTPQIYTMSAEGGDVKRLTFKGNYNQTPDWSPRGDLIVFTARDERNAFDLFTVHVDTGKVNRLTQGEGNNEEPSFSPNGRLVLFTSTRMGSPHPFVTTFDGNNPVALPIEKGTYTTPDWGS